MKKKFTILLVALLSSFALRAQTQKGNQLLGGNLSASHTKSTGTYLISQTSPFGATGRKDNSYSIGPSYTYFIADNLGLGGSLGYNHSHVDSFTEDRTEEFNANGYLAYLSLMKYFLFEKTIGVRTGPYAQYNKSTGKYISTDAFYDGNKQDYKNFAAGINLDFVYFPVKKIGLVASIGGLSYFDTNTEDKYNSNKQNGIGFSFFNSPSFSIYYAF
jgi:hypothetical protein